MRIKKDVETRAFLKKLFTYCILICIIISLFSNFIIPLSAKETAIPKIEGDTTTTEPKTTETTTTEPETTETTTTEPKTTETTIEEEKIIEDEPIKNAVDWLNDNYENSTINDNVKDTYDFYYTKIDTDLIETDIGDIQVGEKVVIKNEENYEIVIEELEFVISKDCNNVKFTIEKLESKPLEIIEEPTVDGIVYEYLDIKLTSNGTYLHEEEFESMKFEFKVEKTWILDNNIDKDTIILVRYHNVWQNLITVKVNEDENYIYFEASSPGLSTYTVVGTKMVEASPSLIKEKAYIPLTGWIAIIVFISIILITIVYKNGFIYRSDDERK